MVDHEVRFIPARAGNARSSRAAVRASSVHPRASGERGSPGSTALNTFGSSPRERGTRHDLPRRRHVVRFIPARAGNAPPRRRSRRRAPVHPRASGEREWNQCAAAKCVGSSPRERGTRRLGQHGQALDRFIPARAGNAVARSCQLRHWSVHPRASGERNLDRAHVFDDGGSSPRERGTLFLEELDLAGILRCQTAHRQIRHFSTACHRLLLCRQQAVRNAPA